MIENLIGKRLLILGGNPETAALVKYANDLGIHTIVIDPNPNAPAKRIAQESYDLEVMNPDILYVKAKSLNLDGILVGVADILVPSYSSICLAMSFPCYVPIESIDILTTKSGFRTMCEKTGLDVIPYYPIKSDFNDTDLKEIVFPVLVKPVDNGAGVGMNVSRNLSELREHIEIAIKHSKRKKFLVERYMDCDDMFVYYTISDGVPYLTASADRFTTKSQSYGSPVCTGALYPSKYLQEFLNTTHPKIVKLIKDCGIKDGVLNIQFFVDNGKFYAYDPGFRLQGEAPHLHLNELCNFDSRKMLIHFALTSQSGEPDLGSKVDPFFGGKKAFTLWILLKEGKISLINGLEEVRKHSNVFQIVQRLYNDDVVDSGMIGTERQVFARIYMHADSIKDLKEIISFIQKTLIIENSIGESLILENFNFNNL